MTSHSAEDARHIVPDDDRGWSRLLLAISALGCLLRIVALPGESLWYDEAVSARLLNASWSDLIRGVARDNGNPSLYLVLAKGWAGAFGDSPVALRSFPSLLGALTVPLLGLLGRRLDRPRVGLIAAGLLAISPMAIELSNEIRTYALAGLLAVASTLAFVEWVDGRQARNLALYVATMAAAFYSHYFTFVLVIAHGAYMVFQPRDRRRDLGWLAAVAAAFLVWTLWIPVLIAQLRTSGNLSRMGDRWVLQFLATPLSFAFGRTLAWRDDGRVVLGLSTLAAIVTLWLPAVWGWLRLRSRPGMMALLGAWAFLPILGPLAVALTYSPIYMTRYAYVGLPGFLLLAAVGLDRLPGWARRAALALIVVLSAVALARYAAFPLRDDWRSATTMILADISDGEIVLADNELGGDPFLYYANRPGRRPPALIVVKKVTGSDGRILGISPDRPRPGDGGPPDDLTARIFDARGVWLALRTPGTSPEAYQAMFERRGFRLEARRGFQRIDVMHLVRPPQ